MSGKPGCSGGKREGAGRKPKPSAQVAPNMDPLEFLRGVMAGTIEATALQVRSAIAAAQYVHAKVGEAGKKSAKGDAAKTAGAGRFAPTTGPRLAAVNGQKVEGGKAA